MSTMEANAETPKKSMGVGMLMSAAHTMMVYGLTPDDILEMGGEERRDGLADEDRRKMAEGMRLSVRRWKPEHRRNFALVLGSVLATADTEQPGEARSLLKTVEQVVCRCPKGFAEELWEEIEPDLAKAEKQKAG